MLGVFSEKFGSVSGKALAAGSYKIEDDFHRRLVPYRSLICKNASSSRSTLAYRPSVFYAEGTKKHCFPYLLWKKK
jgi:hypothetical protein